MRKGKFVTGALLGAGLGLLFAPKPGSETRKDVKKKLDELYANLKNIDLNEVKENFTEMIDEIKYELSDLDKEKVLALAEAKGKALLKKADGLVKYAVEKGTPILQKSAKDLKKKVVEVLEETTKKLKESEKPKAKSNNN